MRTVAKIRENDEKKGKVIRLGYTRAEYEGKRGWRVAASNGEDVGHYNPLTKPNCIRDIYSQWQNWDTFEAV